MIFNSNMSESRARRFLLLGQGDFVESLLDAAQEERFENRRERSALCKQQSFDVAAPKELNAEASSIQRHQLMGLLDMARHL